jgi:aminocarboxymuconate-semialdehyde decarboxylase
VLGEDEPGRLIESLADLSEETKARLLGGTALEFLGVDAGAFR